MMKRYLTRLLLLGGQEHCCCDCWGQATSKCAQAHTAGWGQAEAECWAQGMHLSVLHQVCPPELLKGSCLLSLGPNNIDPDFFHQWCVMVSLCWCSWHHNFSHEVTNGVGGTCLMNSYPSTDIACSNRHLKVRTWHQVWTQTKMSNPTRWGFNLIGVHQGRLIVMLCLSASCALSTSESLSMQCRLPLGESVALEKHQGSHLQSKKGVGDS